MIFFFSIALYNFVKWTLFKKTYHLFFILLALFFSSLFHGAMFVGVLAVGLIIFFYLLFHLFSVLKNYLMKTHVATLYSFAIVLFLILLVMPLPRIGKIGGLLSTVTSGDIELEVAAMAISRQAENRAIGTTAYLENVTLNQPADLIWQAPVRMIYFLYSPFPWDISALRHLKGLIDSGFLIFMTLIMWKYRKKLWKNDVYRYLLIILIIYILAFSFGTSNVGSAIRHKAKFLPIILLFYGLKDQVRYLPVIMNRSLSSQF